MKRANWVRLIAMILVISMLAAPVSAATFGGPGHSTNGLIGSIIGIIKDIIIEIIDDWFDIPGVGDPDPTEPPVPTTPEEPTPPSEPVATDPTEPEVTEPEVTEPEETEPEVTEPVETEPAVETVLELVEDFSTVENGHLLRGTTYTLSQIVAQQPQTAPYALRSSPVSTLADEGTTGGGNSEFIEAEKKVFTNWVDGGQYYIQSAATSKEIGSGNGWVKVNNGVPASLTQGAQSEATAWTVTFNKDGTYALSVSVDGTDYYLSISGSGISFSTTAVALQIENFSPTRNPTAVNDDGNLMRIGADGRYLNRNSNTTFTTYDIAGGANNSLWLYQVKDGTTNKVTVETVTENVKVVYFPVTMFNYDTDAINNATKAKEYRSESDTWNGIYFSGGTPSGNDYVITVPGDPTVTTVYEVTYERVTPTINNNRITNLDPEADYILVNKRSGRAVTVGTSGSNDGSNMKLVDSADLGLGQELASAPESFKVTYEAANSDNASIWKYYSSNGSRYFRTTSNAYMTFTDDSSGINTRGTALSFGTVSGDSNAFTIYYTTWIGWSPTNLYLSDHGGGNRDYYRGLASANDGGNPFYIYKRSEPKEITTEIPNDTTTTYTKNSYAGHNYFNKGGGKADGDLVWTGLAADHLDENENIVFNYPDGGIFSYDRDALDENYFDGVKNVYEFVGMPFVLSDGIYTFDSDQNGVYFEDTDGDLDNDPAPGTSEAFNNLKFDYGIPQPLHMADMDGEGGVADKSRNGWFPYNLWATRTVDNVTKIGYGMIDPELYDNKNMDYHFGMRADLPFSMTPNGRIKSHDDESTPITFNFSGDDDVWIYIDGQLVVDLGGMHNRLDIEINFAENTITYKEHTVADANDTTGSYNDPEHWSDVRKLFNESEGDGLGLIDMTRAEFAIDHNHEMQFFYLERGRGTSNCKIEFNLPMLDTVMVTKNITRSWSAEQARLDAIDGEGDGTSPLTAQEKAALANKPFYFTLYRKTANNPTPVAVANTSYYLLDAEGNVLDIPSTGPDGKFFLLNGQTAKFMTDFPTDGITYFVVEDKLPKGYLTPDFTFAGESAYGFDYTGVTMDAKGDTVTVIDQHVTNASEIPEQEIPLDADPQSFEITATGSVEAIESLHFICENYLDKDLPNPSALAEEDIIVIDYGLPVQIDPLANDVFRGDSIEIVHYTVGDVNFTDAEGKISKEVGDRLENEADKNLTGVFGNFEFHDPGYRAEFDNKGNMTSVVRDTFTYTLNKQLTEVEVLTYVVKVTGSETQDATDTTDTDYCYGQAKLYIVPATIMYYEEDFTGLIQVLNSTGENKDPVVNREFWNPYQEPGVVGTVNDSTYGTDVAYLHDSEDSNGTSLEFDTTKGYVRFQYTFTGTGTTFFARTGADTGYMQVLLFKGVMEPDENGNVSHYSGKQMATYYRDTYFEDTEKLLPVQGDTLYNIPVYTVDGLTYGTYTVLVTVAKAGTPGAGPGTPTTNAKKHNCFDKNGESIAVEANTPDHVCRNNEGDVLYTKGSGNKFYLDGVRVMQPLNEKSREDLVVRALDAYDIDFETNLDVITLRQKLITDVEDGEVKWDGIHYVMLTDTIGTVVKPEDYIDCGPKEEVYLAPGQTVTFSLKYWHPEGLKLYMGMKAPFGEASLNVGKPPYTLYNTVDSYFDVTQDYASLITDKEPVTDTYGNPMYYNADGKFYIKAKDANGNYYFCDEEYKVVDVDENNLTLLEREYNIVTYTFTATDSIVSLTNIKVVGSYEFTIVPGYDIHIPGSESGATENGGNGEGTPDEGTPNREEEQP